MRVILSATLLVREHLPALTRLLMEAAEGRHLVHCDDPDALDHWLARQGETGAWLREALDVAVREELRAVEDQLTIYIVEGEADWERRQPRLPPAEGFPLCAEPVHVWVEDNVTDRAFLLWIAGEELGGRLRRLEGDRWLVFGHGGGSGLKQRVRAHCEREAGRLRSFAMVDSDALDEEEEVGKTQRAVLDVLRANLGERVWCLHRRMMENYLPAGALAMAVEEGMLSAEFVHEHAALGRRGWWLHLKKGILGDQKRLAREGREDPFADLAPEVRARLARGHEEIGKLWLRSEAQRWRPDAEAEAEAQPHLQRLAALL